ncbi:MAG TPA: hypothetical protein VGM08_00250 [Candidatus Saccharimonadales bacterium]
MRPLTSFDGDDPSIDYDVLLEGGNACLAPAFYMSRAAELFRLALSIQTRERLRRVWVAMSFLDWLLDHAPDREKGREAFNQLVLGTTVPELRDLPPWKNAVTIREVVSLFVSSIEMLDTIVLIQQLGVEIADFGPRKARARTLVGYIRLARRELVLSGKLAIACLSEDERARPEYRRFRAWIIQAVVALGMRDHYRDHIDDYDNAIMRVRPTRLSQAILRCYWWWSAARLFAISPHITWGIVEFAAEFDYNTILQKERG